ncbi:MAG: DUF1648 domain-containing protein [Candidatus Pacebacteria bacterium]|nr:DUF1648 domain-containing protein [Candidatus Paceibacterota bacterium]
MNKTRLLILSVSLLFFVISIYVYPLMPDMVASHWDMAGEADGYSSKFWGLFLIPIISLVILILLIVVPKIDPLKDNINKFRDYFDKFILVFLTFFLYLHILTIAYNLEYYFNFTQFLTPAFGFLFYYIGILIGKAQRNWSIGIRTPWTLSSDFVWDKTHKLGSKLFKLSGVIALVSIILPKYAIVFVLVPVLISSLYVLVYSYIIYNKNK